MVSLAVASPAFARDPAPKPSGIVVHLFGQDSIMSNVLPTAPASAGNPASANTVGGASNMAASPQAASNYVEPTTGEILHQMFVTGDPNNPPKPAPGRVADRPGK